jgi:hypothetical protein
MLAPTSGPPRAEVKETIMCRRVTCEKCGKPTFAGCGAHIEQVLGDVPKAERCTCREQGASGSSGKGGPGTKRSG